MSLALRVIKGGLSEAISLEASVFEELEIPDGYWEMLDAERAAWAEEDRLIEESSRQLALRALSELIDRQKKPRLRGRPAYLSAYKEYQRDYLMRWTRVIECRSNLTQEALADLFGLDDAPGTEGARHWREMKIGKCPRLSLKRFIDDVLPVVKRERWYRRGSMTSLWLCEPYMSEAKFIEWARKRTLKLA